MQIQCGHAVQARGESPSIGETPSTSWMPATPSMHTGALEVNLRRRQPIRLQQPRSAGLPESDPGRSLLLTPGLPRRRTTAAVLVDLDELAWRQAAAVPSRRWSCHLACRRRCHLGSLNSWGHNSARRQLLRGVRRMRPVAAACHTARGKATATARRGGMSSGCRLRSCRGGVCDQGFRRPGRQRRWLCGL